MFLGVLDIWDWISKVTLFAVSGKILVDANFALSPYHCMSDGKVDQSAEITFEMCDIYHHQECQGFNRRFDYAKNVVLIGLLVSLMDFLRELQWHLDGPATRSQPTRYSRVSPQCRYVRWRVPYIPFRRE